jgi:hypothetical protein
MRWRAASLSRVIFFHAVLLPERFRGGFAFGAGHTADLSREEDHNQKDGPL